MPCTMSRTRRARPRGVSVRNSTPQPSETPRKRTCADLDQLAAVVAVGERPKYTEKSSDGGQWLMTAKPASDGRLKGLVEHPVGDDVLDVVAHHAEHREGEIGAEAAVMERGEGKLAGLSTIVPCDMQSSSPDRPGVSWAGPLLGQNGFQLATGARDYLANARDLVGLDRRQ